MDKTVGVCLKQNDFNEKQETTFANLANGYRNNSCVIIGDVDTIKLLGEKGYLPGINYKAIINRHMETQSIVKKAKCVFALCFPSLRNDSICIAYMIDKKIDINLDHLDIPLQFQKCSLVCEDLNDTDFMEIIAKYYVYSNNFKGFQVKFSHENGGGENHGKVMKRKHEEQRFVLGIVDSDLKYPVKESLNDSHYGQTYQMAKAEFEQISDHRACLYALPVHEAENLVPYSLMQEPEKKNSWNQKALDKIGKIKNSCHCNALCYYDYKRSIDASNNDQVYLEY